MNKLTGWCRKYIGSGIPALLVAGCLVSGCSRRSTADFYAELSAAPGMKPECRVNWRGVDVGGVKAVKVDAAGVRVDVVLDAAYRGKLRQGVKARASTGFLGKSEATLELYGGDDSAMPLLPSGARVPEAGAVETISERHWVMIAVAFLIVIAAILVLKAIRKILAVLFALALLAAAGWFVWVQWQRYHSEVMRAETEARINAYAEQILKSPEAQSAWQNMRRDVASAVAEAKAHGRDSADRAAARVQGILRAKAAELMKGSATNAAADLERLKVKLDDFTDSATR